MEWCCRNSEIWEDEEEGPPCSICPMEDYVPDEFNIFCLERWKYLDIFGRDRAFSEAPLREEAIDAHLSRYKANTEEIYESVCKIEIKLYGDRQNKEMKKKKEEDKKRKEKKSNVPRRTASLK